MALPSTSSPNRVVVKPPDPGFVMPSYSGDNHNGGGNSLPSAPPVEAFAGGQIAGYEGTSYERSTVPPPPSYYSLPPSPGIQGRPRDFSNLPSITSEEAKECLENYVASKCCYGRTAIDEIVIDDIQMSSSYYYKINSLTELREAEWVFEPIGTSLPPPAFPGARPPACHELPVAPPPEFMDAESSVEVPNTSFNRECHGCSGVGKRRCTSCAAIGSHPCTFCMGTGVRHNGDSASPNRCISCNGTGRRPCSTCNATGLMQCPVCQGHSTLRFFLRVTVTWKNVEDEFVSDATGLKAKYIKKVSGIKAIEEESKNVYPLHNFPDRSIAEASKTLLDKQDKDARDQYKRVIRQRQLVKVVPIAVVYYTYRHETKGTFYIFGDKDEQQVYFHKYPLRCCYCCSIL